MFNDLYAKLKSVANTRNYKPTDFLDVISKADNENIVSAWIAFLLEEKKCSSNIPLKALCEYLRLEYSQVVCIRREFVLDGNRRIDIFVQMQNAWIVIENKINSFECNRQTVDYAERVKALAGKESVQNCVFVYLKPNYNKSAPSSNDFTLMTYGDLFSIWHDIDEAYFANRENYLYLKEFLKLIKGKYAMNNELDFNDNTKLYLECFEQIREVEKDYAKSCGAVKNKLVSALRTVFAECYGWVINDNRYWIQLYRQTWGAEIHFEIGIWNQDGKSFDRLISSEVCVKYCLHAERSNAAAYAEAFKQIERNNCSLFCEIPYVFSTESDCLKSIDAIVEHMKEIEEKITPIVDELLLKGEK